MKQKRGLSVEGGIKGWKHFRGSGISGLSREEKGNEKNILSKKIKRLRT